MKSRSITLHCENCCFGGRPTAEDTFDVNVPLTDVVSGERYVAQLRCEISTDEHRISLLQLSNDQGESADPDDDTRERLNALLDRVANNRICGNADICPNAVVDIVQRSMREHVTERSPSGAQRQGRNTC